MDLFEKQQRICKLAEQDEAYRAWRDIYQKYCDAFETFVETQPVEIQDMLWGYAGGGRFMNQRLLNLACQYLEFPNIHNAETPFEE